MEQNPAVLTERTVQIIRRSIHTLLKDFQYFTTTPVILVLPFSASFLLSQYLHQSFSLAKSLSLPSIRIPFLNQSLPQVVFSCALISFPFAVSCLVMAKASIIESLKPTSRQLCAPFMSIYKRLVITYIYNIVLMVITNVASLFLLFIAFKFLEEQFGLTSIHNPLFVLAGGIVFYMILTNSMVICNLSLVLAGMVGCTGWKAIHKACLLRKGTSSVSLLLSLPINAGLAGIEALFSYRVVRGHDHLLGRPNMSSVLEGLLIAYLFSLLIVLDTIACCLFVKEFESSSRREATEIDHRGIGTELVIEEHRISDCSRRLEEIL